MPFCLISSSTAGSPFPSYLRQPYTTEILDFLTGIKIFFFFFLSPCAVVRWAHECVFCSARPLVYFWVFLLVRRPERHSPNSNNVKCEAAGSVLC